MKIAISTETTVDLSKELLDKYNIHTVPCSVILGAEAKLDGEVSNQDLFDYVKQSKQLPKTSATNQFQYEEHFKKLLESYDEVIHVTISNELSSMCRNAITVASQFNNKVHIIDSRSLSTGIALVTLLVSDLVSQNLPINEIISKVREQVSHVQASFVIQSVDYLYKGGRCSKVAMFGANLFHICPQIVVKDGVMEPGKKFRGKYFNVISQYVDETLKEFNNPDLKYVFITYSSLDDEENIIKMVKDKLTQRGFQNVYITSTGATIASHCGPNTLGILYLNK